MREFWHSEFEEFKLGQRLSPLSFISVDGTSNFSPLYLPQSLKGQTDYPAACVFGVKLMSIAQTACREFYPSLMHGSSPYLSLEACGVCGPMVIFDCAVGQIVRLSNPLIRDSTSAVRRCGVCAYSHKTDARSASRAQQLGCVLCMCPRPSKCHRPLQGGRRSDARALVFVEALKEYEDSKFGDDTTRMDLKSPTSFNTVQDPEQVKIMVVMQLEGLISSIYLMQKEIEIFKAELTSPDDLRLSQSTTASIAVVEELSSEDAAEFEERVTTRKAKRAKMLLKSASKVPTSLSSALTRTRRPIRVPQRLNL